MKGLDLSKFKKVKTDKSSTTLKHPDGHTIRIAHDKLSPEMKKNLTNLPSYEDGGEIQTGVDKLKSAGGMKNVAAKPAPTPTLDEKYAKIRKQNTENFTGPNKNESGNYADGGDVTPSPTPDPSQPALNTDKKKSFQDSFKKKLNLEAGGSINKNAQNQLDALEKEDYTSNNTEASHKFLEAHSKLVNVHHQIANALTAGATTVKNYAEGGATEPQGFAMTPQEANKASGGTDFESTDPTTRPGVMQLTDAQTAPITPPGQPETQTSSAPKPLDLMGQAQGAVAQQNKAELASAGITSAQQAANAQTLGNEAQGFQDIRAHYEKIGNDLHQKYDDLAQDVAKGQINPNQWWESKSTGGKILSAIGMLIGGAGAGVSGHPELATKAVDNAIDRDIEAQKANLGKKESLLSKYMEMYKSLPEAENAARLTLHAGVEGLINQQAAKSGSANAINVATAANAQRRQALLPTLEGLARGSMQINTLNNMQNTPPGADPASQVRHMTMSGVMSAEQGKEALKEIGSSQKINKLQKDFEESSKDLSSKVLAGKLSPSDRNSARTAFAGILAKESEGRFNLEESKLQADALLPAPFDSKQTLANKARRREQFFDAMRTTPTLQAYGIKSGPTTQAPQETKTMNGIQYTKVPGGWQRVK